MSAKGFAAQQVLSLWLFWSLGGFTLRSFKLCKMKSVFRDDRGNPVLYRYTEMNGKQSLIEKFVNTLLPEDWASRDLEQRLAFWADGFSDEQAQGTVPRRYVCAMEIWRELFGGSVRDYTPMQTREINSMLKRLPGWTSRSCVDCGPIYGKQRGYVRIE